MSQQQSNYTIVVHHQQAGGRISRFSVHQTGGMPEDSLEDVAHKIFNGLGLESCFTLKSASPFRAHIHWMDEDRYYWNVEGMREQGILYLDARGYNFENDPENAFSCSDNDLRRVQHILDGGTPFNFPRQQP